jgi:metal-responsive CopG/Arc/MetJ family transcriptional regulator
MKKVKQMKRGRGRPVEIDADVAIGMRLPSKLLDELDTWAKSRAVTRSEAIREFIERGLRKKGA